jgi:hypothetical protein
MEDLGSLHPTIARATARDLIDEIDPPLRPSRVIIIGQAQPGCRRECCNPAVLLAPCCRTRVVCLSWLFFPYSSFSSFAKLVSYWGISQSILPSSSIIQALAARIPASTSPPTLLLFSVLWIEVGWHLWRSRNNLTSGVYSFWILSESDARRALRTHAQSPGPTHESPDVVD